MPNVPSNTAQQRQQRQRVVVVGGSTVDIEGAAAAQSGKPRRGDSIPGRVSYAAGGVGRNIAENLARLGVDTWLVSAVGDDPFGNYVREETAASGVNVSGMITLAGRRTGCYLSVLNEEREMVSAVADIAVALELTSTLDRVAPIIRDTEILVLDCNISEEMLVAAVDLCSPDALIVAEPVSATKALRLRPVLDRLTLITPNRIEAEALCAIDGAPSTDSGKSVEELAHSLQRRGVEEVIVTLGEQGVYWSGASGGDITARGGSAVIRDDDAAAGGETAAHGDDDAAAGGGEPSAASDRRGAYYRPPSLTNRPRSVTGAGDAFAAGVVYGRLHGYSPTMWIGAGFAAAGIAMESERAVNPQMSLAALHSRSALFWHAE